VVEFKTPRAVHVAVVLLTTTRLVVKEAVFLAADSLCDALTLALVLIKVLVHAALQRALVLLG